MLEVVFAHEIQYAVRQLLKAVFCDFLLKGAVLEIPAGEKTHQVTQFATIELMHEGNTQHIIIFRVVDVIVIVLKPFHLGTVGRLHELSIHGFKFAVECGFYGEVAEIIDSFAE